MVFYWIAQFAGALAGAGDPDGRWPRRRGRAAWATTAGDRAIAANTRCRPALVFEVVMTALFVIVILGSTWRPARRRVRGPGHRHRPGGDPHRRHPGHRRVGQPGAQLRPGGAGRRARPWRSCGCSSSPRRSGRCMGALLYRFNLLRGRRRVAAQGRPRRRERPGRLRSSGDRHDRRLRLVGRGGLEPSAARRSAIRSASSDREVGAAREHHVEARVMAQRRAERHRRGRRRPSRSPRPGRRGADGGPGPATISVRSQDDAVDADGAAPPSGVPRPGTYAARPTCGGRSAARMTAAWPGRRAARRRSPGGRSRGSQQPRPARPWTKAWPSLRSVSADHRLAHAAARGGPRPR